MTAAVPAEDHNLAPDRLAVRAVPAQKPRLLVVPRVGRGAFPSVPVDLAALWHDLGVRVEGRQARFDDAAPLASARRAITAPDLAPR